MEAEIRLLKMAFEQMHSELEALKSQNVGYKNELESFKASISNQKENNKEKIPKDDLLINTREVLSMLGICYNTLQKIIADGYIKPIRINQRRIRFSKQGILDYIHRL